MTILTDARVLRSRPFSETLGSIAASAARERGARRIVDLGTGSGIVALAIGRRLPGVEIWATEIRPEALEVARLNAEANAVPLRFALGDWFEALPEELRGTIDLAVATPPWMSAAEYERENPASRAATPALAMVGGATGLEPARSLAAQGLTWLRPGAPFYVESHPNLLDETAAVFAESGYDVTRNSWMPMIVARCPT